MSNLLIPIGRALAQLDDSAFIGVVLRGLLISALAFLLLLAGGVWGADHLARGLLGSDLPGTGLLAAVITGAGASILAFFLFLPVAGLIGSLFVERIAVAVERRWYPALPQGTPAPVAAQVWDGVTLGVRILVLQLGALLLTLLIPAIGFVLGWAITAYAIGRGLFVAVAMRRASRLEAEALYRRLRLQVLAQGGLIAAAAYLPLINLLVPILGTAAMVHVLDRTLETSIPSTRGWLR